MLSQASQLPHLTVPALAFDFASKHSSRPGGRCALAFDLDLRHPVKPRWHTEPKRGAEWWGKSVLLTFALFKSEPL
jgi:hypothetical protein